MKKMPLFTLMLCMVFGFVQCTGPKANTTQKSDTEKIYIIMFKMGDSDKTDTPKTTREAPNSDTNDFEQQANKILEQANIFPSKVQHYYSAIKGVAVKLTEEQAQKMEQNPNVTSIEADQHIKVDLPKPEGKQ